VNGIIPPTNPDSIGAPAGLYWGWHALLALFVVLFDITSFQSLLFINSVALSVSLLSLWYISGLFTARVLPRVAALTWPFFVLNPVRGIKEFILAVFDGTFVVEILKPWLFSKNYLFVIKGMVDSRPSDFIGKFLNFTSFPTAFCLVVLTYAAVACSFPRRTGARLFMVAAASFLVAVFHPVSVFALAALLGVTIAERFGTSWSGGLLSRRAFLAHVAPGLASAAGVLCAIPYLHSLSSSFAQPVGFHLPLTAKELSYEGWALLPAIPLYTYSLIRIRTLGSAGRAALAGGVLFAVLSLCMVLPDHNEYKFTYYFTVVTALLLVELLDRLWRHADSLRSTSARTAVRFLCAAVVSVSLLSPFVTARKHLAHEWAREDPYVYDGRYARLREDAHSGDTRDLQQAFEWIRGNTSPEDYILALPMDPPQSRITFLTGRRVVTNAGSIFTGTIRYQNELERAATDAIEALRDCANSEEALRRLEAVSVEWPDSLYALVESPAACPDEPALRLVYRNPAYKIYRILFDDPAE
jgi:hypothetical protein